MAWNYIVAHGKEQATPLIKQVWAGWGGSVCACVLVSVSMCIATRLSPGVAFRSTLNGTEAE